MNKTSLERLYNGLVKENPTFVLMLGMCPTLAVTTSAINGMGMGLATAVVLALSNLIISLMRKIIPSKVRIPAFIVIIASFVTVLQLLLEAYLPSLNESLGVYIPLIVVNCIILGRAEAYAYSNPPIPSLFDGIGMGLGFTVALTMIGAVREVLGAAKFFGIEIPGMIPIGIFVLAPGAFFVLAILTAIQNFVKIQGEKRGKDMSKIQSGCNEDCMSCSDMGCSKRFLDTQAKEELETETKTKTEEEISLQKTKTDDKELDFIDLDEETVEAKPKRKPRKKAPKTEETSVEEPKTEESVAEKPEPQAPVEEEPKAEASKVEEAVADEPIAEAKPKRKPRKKVEKVEEPKAEESVAEETKAEEAKTEEVGAENPSVDEPVAEAKPKRKPRKKTVKQEEPSESPKQEKKETDIDSTEEQKEDKS